MVISVSLYFPYPARVTLHEVSEWPLLPSAQERIYGGSIEDGNRNPKGRVAEAERRRAAGRRTGPKRDPEQRAGYEAEGSHWTTEPIACRFAEVRPNRSSSLLAMAPKKDGLWRPPLRSSRLAADMRKVLRDR